jgi:hypothetical protein
MHVFLTEHFKSSGSVRNHLSGIKTWTVLLKFDVEEFYSPTLKMTLSGVEKLRDLISVHRDNKSATLLSIP